jgi:MraZ protein
LFFGEHYHSLDEKGRVILPAKFRDALGDGFFITKSMDACLEGYTKQDWMSFVEKTMSMSGDTQQVRSYQRRRIGSAVECEVSRQGRVSIPQNLREYAGLNKEIVIVGIANKLEIWAKDRYEAALLDSEALMGELGDSAQSVGV